MFLTFCQISTSLLDNWHFKPDSAYLLISLRVAFCGEKCQSDLLLSENKICVLSSGVQSLIEKLSIATETLDSGI